MPELETVCKCIWKWSRLLFYLHACLPVAAGRKRWGHGCDVRSFRRALVQASLLVQASGGRTDGPTDGWKYHVTASDGLRRELSRAPLRTAGQPLQHPSQFDRRRQPLLSRPSPGRLSTRNAAAAHANGKLENMKRLGVRNPSGTPAGWAGFADGKLSLSLHDMAVQNKRFTGRLGDTASDFIAAMCA